MIGALRSLNCYPLGMVVLTWLSVLGSLTAQSPPTLPSATRTFATKNGDEFTARIISLSGDESVVTLQTADGIAHRLEATALSLENQLFLRDWIEAQEARQSAPVATRIAIHVEPVVTKFERRHIPVAGHPIKHEEMHEAYNLKLEQAKPTAHVALRVSYLILYWDKIAVYEVDDGRRTDWSSLSGQGRLRYCMGKFRLAVDRDSEFRERMTASIKTDRLEGETEADRLGHDQLIGIHVRAVDPFGNVVAKFTDLPKPFAALDWTTLDVSRRGADAIEDGDAVTGRLDLEPSQQNP